MRIRSAMFLGLLVIVAACEPGATTTTGSTTSAVVTAQPPTDIALPESRTFSMGFTPWPYDFDQAAVDWTWNAIADHGDIVAIHLDTGVPWTEVADDEPFPRLVRADLEDAARRSDAFEKVYVAVTPLHSDRASIAWYWDDEGTQRPLPARWNGRRLDDPEVVAGYIEYCLRVIDLLDPDWFAYGIEVNAGYEDGGPEHDAMIGLARAVYPAIKAAHPDLPTFLTFQIGSWETSTDEAMAIAESLLPWSDLTGISAYPYLDFENPLRSEAVPGPVTQWMDRMAAFGKPLAIAETGYAAEPLIVPSIPIDLRSTAEWQTDWVTDLLDTAALHDSEFVIYWAIRDYDEGFQFLLDLGADPALAAVWRDIGLLDGEGAPRPALGVWDAWLGLPAG